MPWLMSKTLFSSAWIEYKVAKNYNGTLPFEFVLGINMKSQCVYRKVNSSLQRFNFFRQQISTPGFDVTVYRIGEVLYFPHTCCLVLNCPLACCPYSGPNNIN